MQRRRFIPLLFSLSCGSPSSEVYTSATVPKLLTKSDQTVVAEVSFVERRGTARIINGTVAEAKNESCIDKVTLHFNQPMSVGTLMGNVRLIDALGNHKALAVTSINSNHQQFVLQRLSPGVCSGSAKSAKILLNSGIFTVSGLQLPQAIIFDVQFPSSNQSAVNKFTMAFPLKPSNASSAMMEVKPTQLNRAYAAMANWQTTEQELPIYNISRLTLIPTHGVKIFPYDPLNRRRHYGSRDLIFVLRRAAFFLNQLFPASSGIPLADLSNSNGSTPFMQIAGETILLHPKGSHTNGTDADVGYLYLDSARKQIDWEKTFWLVYAIIESSHIDLIISSFKPELQKMAEKAHRAGLINEIAVGRFDSSRFQQNIGLNHDKHIHFSAKNQDNPQGSRRFSFSDSVYSCYIHLKPKNRGAGGNHCGY